MAAPRRPKYVLAFIVGLLVASGGVRMAIGVGPAIAFAEEQMTATADASHVTEAETDMTPLIAAIQAREDRIADRELAIEDRLRAMMLAEEELIKRLEELQAAEASLTAALSLSETANNDDIVQLTTVYENMKPADAASLFEEMAPDFASGFLVRMRPDAAAAIMAGLEPGTAYSISVIIAGRNANAPTE